MSSSPDSKSTLLVEPAACQAGPEPGRWLITWRIQNCGTEPLRLLEAWLPHGQFWGERQAFTPIIELSSEENTLLERAVTCIEPPGSEIENAFLILRVLWHERQWRVFARLRIFFERSGAPQPTCEAVTVEPIGIAS